MRAIMIVPMNDISSMVFISSPGFFIRMKVVESQITIIDIAVQGYFIVILLLLISIY